MQMVHFSQQPALRQSTIRLKGVNGGGLQVIGKTNAEFKLMGSDLSLKHRKHTVEVIADEGAPSILGIDFWLDHMQSNDGSSRQAVIPAASIRCAGGYTVHYQQAVHSSADSCNGRSRQPSTDGNENAVHSSAATRATVDAGGTNRSKALQ